MTCSAGPAPLTPAGSSKERTLWQLCFDSNGIADFPSDKPPHKPPCKNWEYPKYKVDGPILVGIDYSAALNYKNILAAVDFWNAALGYKALKVAVSGDIRILVYGKAPRPRLAGMATPFKIDGKLYNRMILFGMPSLSTVVHEFGHALGLGHDPSGNNVMAPVGEQRLTVHPEDLRAIRRLYGRE